MTKNLSFHKLKPQEPKPFIPAAKAPEVVKLDPNLPSSDFMFEPTPKLLWPIGSCEPKPKPPTNLGNLGGSSRQPRQRWLQAALVVTSWPPQLCELLTTLLLLDNMEEINNWILNGMELCYRVEISFLFEWSCMLGISDIHIML